MSTNTTSRSVDALFELLVLRNITLKNRLIRSATYEGYGDDNGMPQPELAELYSKLADGGVGTIVTGFAYISQAGRAMQPNQCGIDTDEKTAAWKHIVSRVRHNHAELRLFMQLAHTGRQTRRAVTGLPVLGVSSRRCTYFKQRVHAMDDVEIENVIQDFGTAARRAKEAGFDGVQIHAGHGYLIHQFLSPWTNTRKDKWAEGPLFLEAVIQAIRKQCGADFPILVKLSWADDNKPGLTLESTIRTVKRLELLEVDAVEISYGSMEFALNIIRGACPVAVIFKVNPLFTRIPRLLQKLWKRLFLPGYIRKFQPFSENYNVEAATTIKAATSLPVIAVGGIKTVDGMLDCLDKGLAAVSLCRPLICEPDLPNRIRNGEVLESQCTHCNLCTAYCDSSRTVKCYQHQMEVTHENS